MFYHVVAIGHLLGLLDMISDQGSEAPMLEHEVQQLIRELSVSYGAMSSVRLDFWHKSLSKDIHKRDRSMKNKPIRILERLLDGATWLVKALTRRRR